MFDWLRQFFVEDKRLLQLEALCAQEFRENYPSKQLIGWCMIANETDEYLIVRLCYHRGRPPGRTFWKVEKRGSAYGKVEDVTDRAAEFVDLGRWR